MYTEKFEIKEEDLTQVKDAELYVQQAGVDVLAVSVGTFHGMDVTGVSPNLRMDRLREIKSKIELPLVLHGGSGTPENDIKEAIKLGICKININTETRLAFSNTLRKTLGVISLSAGGEIVPYKYLPEAVHAVQAVVEKNIKLFGSVNKI